MGTQQSVESPVSSPMPVTDINCSPAQHTSAVNMKLNLMDSDSLNVKHYLLTYFSLDLELKQLDYFKLTALTVQLQEEQKLVVE